MSSSQETHIILKSSSVRLSKTYKLNQTDEADDFKLKSESICHAYNNQNYNCTLIKQRERHIGSSIMPYIKLAHHHHHEG
jgi:hypothetical protein